MHLRPGAKKALKSMLVLMFIDHFPRSRKIVASMTARSPHSLLLIPDLFSIEVTGAAVLAMGKPEEFVDSI